MDQRTSDRPIKKAQVQLGALRRDSLKTSTPYLIQIPIILFLQGRFVQGGVLIPGGLPPLLQFALVGVLATAFRFLISNYIVRKIPYAERVIF